MTSYTQMYGKKGKKRHMGRNNYKFEYDIVDENMLTTSEMRKENVLDLLASHKDLTKKEIENFLVKFHRLGCKEWRWLWGWFDVDSAYAYKNTLRKGWIKLLFKIWNHPSFNAFYDPLEAKTKMNEYIFLDEKYANTFMVRLSSTIPGAISITYPKITKIDGKTYQYINRRYLVAGDGTIFVKKINKYFLWEDFLEFISKDIKSVFDVEEDKYCPLEYEKIVM